MLSLLLAFVLQAHGVEKSAHTQGDHVRIAAASDLKFALDQLKSEFTKTHQGVEFEIVYGSSGQFEQQIEKGAPFDIFFSADESYPKMLIEKKIAKSEPFRYGQGTLVIWSKTEGYKVLADLKKAKKIAIANPEHAPYGKSAKAALEKAGLYDSLKPNLVIGDSISQTAQFAQTGAADVGLIALALAKAPEMKTGHYAVIKEAEPLQQSGVILKETPTTKEFRDYVMSSQGQALLKEFGFKGAQ